MSIKNDIKDMRSLINDMENQIGFLQDINDTTITDTYELTIELANTISSKSIEEIDEMDIDSIKYMINSANVDADHVVEHFENLKEDNEDYKDKDVVEYFKHVFKDIKKSSDEIVELNKEKDKIIGQVDSMSSDYFAYLNSSEYKEKKRQKIEELREKAANETDEIIKKKTLTILNIMEESMSLEFLSKRLKTINTEAKNTVNTFFDHRRSSLVMEKFKTRMKSMGYTDELYKVCYNIEERFLPSEYHDLNNMFLFHVTRYISYANVNDKRDTLYISTILINMYNLIYHKFESDDDEKSFIEIIKNIDDYFMPYIERFKANNITSPNHPERIKHDEEAEQKRRMMIIASLENKGINPDTTLSTEELRKMLQDTIDDSETDMIQNDDNINDEEDESNSVNTTGINSNNDEIMSEENLDDARVDVYIEIETGCIYDYYENSKYCLASINDNGECTIIRKDISEEEVLRLCSSGIVEKSTIDIVTDSKIMKAIYELTDIEEPAPLEN